MKIEKLLEWNPWWEENKVEERLKGKNRPQYKLLLDSINIKEVTLITGVRRSGKSTLMYQMINNLLKKGVKSYQILFVNFEDNKILDDSLDDIYLSYREKLNPDKKAYIFFDEIHKRKNWELWVKKKYDTKSNNKFVISGSCSYLLKKEYSTLLTGRNISFEVFPLSFKEFLLFNNIKIDLKNIKKGIVSEKIKFHMLRKLKKYLEIGGFPEASIKKDPYNIRILEQYFDDILYKDIINRHKVNTSKIKNLALFFMTNITSLMSFRNLRNSLKISYDSIKDYLSYFEESFLFFKLDFFSYSFKEQKTLASKIYCIDNGLRNAVSFKFSKDEGKLIENIVFIELKRREKEIYYWQNYKKQEVDFVIKEKNNNLHAINVSYTDDIKQREINGLIEFKKKFKQCKSLIILTKNLEKKEKTINFIPLWKFLLE